jgi:hypothetical protein
MITVARSRSGPWWPIVLGLAATCSACAPPAVQPADAPERVAPPAARTPVHQPAKEQPPTPTPIPPTPSNAEQELGRCIASYEDGVYKSAALQCQSALDLGLSAASDRATAHKYLAFIVCVTGREKVCREEFRKALEADPAFELAPAEIGHPVWGPVLRSVRSESAAK